MSITNCPIDNKFQYSIIFGVDKFRKKFAMSSENNVVPDWLNEKFFEKVLRTSDGDKNLTVNNLSSIFKFRSPFF